MFEPIIQFNTVVNRSHLRITRRLSAIAGYDEIFDHRGELQGIKVKTTFITTDAHGNVVNESFYLVKEEAERFIQRFLDNSY
jgi:hypothetical protein